MAISTRKKTDAAQSLTATGQAKRGNGAANSWRAKNSLLRRNRTTVAKSVAAKKSDVAKNGIANECASGNLCNMKQIQLNSFHKCQGCRKPMHGTLCAGKDNEDGNMWCLKCHPIEGGEHGGGVSRQSSRCQNDSSMSAAGTLAAPAPAQTRKQLSGLKNDSSVSSNATHNVPSRRSSGKQTQLHQDPQQCSAETGGQDQSTSLLNTTTPSMLPLRRSQRRTRRRGGDRAQIR